jgi:hypothetical protein
MMNRIILALAVLLMMAGSAHAAKVLNFSWEKYEDTSVDKLMIYMDGSTSVVVDNIPVGDTIASYVLNDDQVEHGFNIVAVKDGQESDFSNTTFYAPSNKPAPPMVGTFKITVEEIQ